MDNTMNNEVASVRNFRQTTPSGRHIRIATLVEFKDGSVVRFTERLSKGEAIRAALAVR